MRRYNQISIVCKTYLFIDVYVFWATCMRSLGSPAPSITKFGALFKVPVGRKNAKFDLNPLTFRLL
jgi:hypothetical protein